MRTYFVAAAALALVACASPRGRGAACGGAAEAVDAPACAPAPSALPAASGPTDAASLAQATGLRYEDQGESVLLTNGTFRARFFPNRDTLSLDGAMTSMSEASRREGTGLVVPADGVAAVRRALSASRVANAAPKPVRVAVLAPAPPPPPAPLPPKAQPVAKHAPAGPERVEPGVGWVPALRERPWKWIVIHHSDDTEGSCAKYDKVHQAKGWDSCGYHFVVGNGTQTRDGQVEVGPRWFEQKQGAHAKTPDNRYNDYGIGVVLVGDFEHGGRPTETQYRETVRLVRWLMDRYSVSVDRVLRHSDCKSTACPGRFFPWAQFLADVKPASPLAPPP